MIQHIVMWKLYEQAEGRSAEENFILVRDALTALRNTIPVVRDLEVYRNVNPDEKNMGMVLVSVFDSMEDLSIYAGHPDHLKAGSIVSKVAYQRSAIDYKI